MINRSVLERAFCLWCIGWKLSDFNKYFGFNLDMVGHQPRYSLVASNKFPTQFTFSQGKVIKIGTKLWWRNELEEIDFDHMFIYRSITWRGISCKIVLKRIRQIGVQHVPWRPSGDHPTGSMKAKKPRYSPPITLPDVVEMLFTLSLGKLMGSFWGWQQLQLCIMEEVTWRYTC